MTDLKRILKQLLEDDTFKKMDQMEADYEERGEWLGRWINRANDLEFYLGEMLDIIEDKDVMLTRNEMTLYKSAEKLTRTTINGNEVV